MKNKNKLNITKACRDALRIMLDLPDAGHSVEHVVRVYDWCRKLAKYYPRTNIKVLRIASFWHDVGRSKQSKEKDDHNIQSAKMVKNYLLKYKVSKDFIKKVEHAVLNHSFKRRPKTIEGKILHDADKLSLLDDHVLLDVVEGLKDGFKNEVVNKKIVFQAVRFFAEKTNGEVYIYQGLVLPEAKKIFKQREKSFLKIIKKVEKMLGDSIKKR